MDLRHYNHVFNLPNGYLVGYQDKGLRNYALKKFKKDFGGKIAQNNDLSYYSGLFSFIASNGKEIAPKRSSFKQTMIDFALGLLFWATFIAIGLFITC